MVIRQGDLFWVRLREPYGSEPGYIHPHVVVQNNAFNATGLNTILMCTLTSNLHRAAAPGNVRLFKGEGGLLKASVVNITQVITADRSQLIEKIGTLSATRVLQIIIGLDLLLHPSDENPAFRF